MIEKTSDQDIFAPFMLIGMPVVNFSESSMPANIVLTIKHSWMAAFFIQNISMGNDIASLITLNSLPAPSPSLPSSARPS
jgi:hypothetical protein